MPYKLGTPCSYPKCPEVTTERFCDYHRKMHQRNVSKSRGKELRRAYNSVRWIRFRNWYLQKNPLCVKCELEGLTTPATDVDHIVPISTPEDPKFVDPDSVQSLCHSCHSKKTATEDGGFGRKRKGG